VLFLTIHELPPRQSTFPAVWMPPPRATSACRARPQCSPFHVMFRHTTCLLTARLSNTVDSVFYGASSQQIHVATTPPNSYLQTRLPSIRCTADPLDPPPSPQRDHPVHVRITPLNKDWPTLHSRRICATGFVAAKPAPSGPNISPHKVDAQHHEVQYVPSLCASELLAWLAQNFRKIRVNAHYRTTRFPLIVPTDV
jgi:hypothetical protein